MKTNNFNDLSIENRENYDRLMKYLMNVAMFDYHIGVEFTNKIPPFAPAVSYNTPGKFIMMNALWAYPTEVPFQLAHEIAHVLHEDQHYYSLNNMTANSGEATANIFAIKLLYKYCKDNEIHFNNYYEFAKVFCIPKHVYYLLEEIA